MKANIRRPLGLYFLAVVLAGCATSSDSGTQNKIIRQAENTPESFSPDPEITPGGNKCHSPMIDFRDNTVIILVSSANGEGNYRVPENKYGVKKGELLRLNCNTGAAIGIVQE